jgi:hypothetical protein
VAGTYYSREVTPPDWHCAQLQWQVLTGTKRKWQPHSSKRIHARREVDLTDTMTDAKIDAFNGPLDLNAANSTRFVNGQLGKDNPKDSDAEGPGSAAFFSRPIFNDRTTIFYNVAS